MADEQSNKPGSGDAWREVGKEFQSLGNTLAEAIRVTWTSEENRRRIQEMQGGLESMVKEINQAIKEGANSPQAQQARTHATRAAETMRTAGEQTVQEIRPQVLSALRQLNGELQKLIERMQAEKQADKTNPPK